MHQRALRHTVETEISLALLPTLIFGGSLLFGCALLAFCAQSSGLDFALQAVLAWLSFFGFLLVAMACLIRSAALSTNNVEHEGALPAIAKVVLIKLPSCLHFIYIPPRLQT